MYIGVCVYNILSQWNKRKAIMYALAIALFVAIVTIVPNLLEWYPKWITETNTPTFFKNMPYLPMWGGWGLVLIAIGFFIFASIREFKRQKHQKSKVQMIEERLDKIESKLN